MRPRTCGLSFSSRTLLSLPRPRALTDRRCLDCEPRRPLTRRTLTVPVPASFLAMDDVLQLLAALGRDVARRVHAGQALDRGADEVDRVARTDGLGQHVLDAHGLEHGAHRATGDDTGTLGRRLHEHAGGAMAGLHGVVQRATVEVHAGHVAAGLLHRLLDRDGDLAGLAVAEADLAGAVAGGGPRGEGGLAGSE